MRSLVLTCAVGALVWGSWGCGDDGVHHLADAPPQGSGSAMDAPQGAGILVISPADDSVTINDGVAVQKAYTVHQILDGVDTDVTATATLSIATNYGTFTGPSLSVSGLGSGPTEITATLGQATGSTHLTVFVKKHVSDPSAPAGAASLFDTAVEDASLAPTVIYPANHILVPPNLGSFDVHWHRDAFNQDDLFEVKLTNDYVDVRLYTPGLDPNQPYWSQFPPEAWYPIASSRQQLTLTVAGMNSAAPATKGTAASQTVDVTNEDSKGGIYYWTSTLRAVMRYDIARPDIAPKPFFTTAPSSCMGCHNMSRDGSKLALTLDGAGGRGSVWDVASQTSLDDVSSAPLYWDFAAFNTNGTKLLTIEGGHMWLRGTDNSAIVATEIPPRTAGAYTTQPEFSPDGTQIVEVEYTSGQDYYLYDGSIVVRSFDDATNTFGTPTVLVAADSTNGIYNYYPSWSPDGKWIVFTRNNGLSYDNATSEIWVVKADGTGQPIKLAISNTPVANLTNSWARWVPFGQTFGPTNEPIFYLTFSSRRAFGVRIPSPSQAQIWMTPFFPDRAEAGLDPSGNAFRVPFQDVQTSNHIAQWTEAIVGTIAKARPAWLPAPKR